MGGALSFTRKSEDLHCRHRVFRLPCGCKSRQWGVPFVSRGSPRIFSHLCQSCTAAPSSCRGLTVGGVLARGVFLWAVPPRVVFPPGVWGLPPSGSFAARGCYLSVMSIVFSAVPASGRPPGQRQVLYAYVCMYVKIRRHQHTRVHAHTGPRRHTRAPVCHRHHIPRLVRRQAVHTDHRR